MAETFLNGKLTVTSLAAPSAEDRVKFERLSAEERNAVIAEAVERGRQSGVSKLTVDDIWDRALRRAEDAKLKKQNAL